MVSVGFPTRLAAGPDYATDVIGDPWDMCNREDMSLRPDEILAWRASASSTAPCRMGGTTMAVNGANDSSVMMMPPGIYDAALNPGRNGRNFPIDSSKYQVFRSSWSDAIEDPQIYWFHFASGDPSGLALAGESRRERSQESS